MGNKQADQIAKELLIDPKFVVTTFSCDEYIDFTINGACYTAKITKQSNIKKNSIRRDFA